MSIASEITRLQNAKQSLKTAINSKNDSEHQITNETLEDYVDFVETIPYTPTEPTKIYGIKRALNSSASTWERINDSVGLVANAQIGSTPVQNDFDSIYPWSDIISYNYDSTNQEITAYYGDNNFAFDGSNGDVFTKIPSFYWRRYRDTDYEYILISKDNFENSIKSETFSIARYHITGSSSRVYSRSGYSPLTNISISNFRAYAQNVGITYSLIDWRIFLIDLLYLVEYADYNSQAKLGMGYTGSGISTSKATGGCDFLGMKSGSENSTETSSMIYRGIEDIYGNVWDFVDGINVKNYYAYVSYNRRTYNSYSYSGDYHKLSYSHATASGFGSSMGYDPANPLIMLPTTTLGSDITTNGTTDYFYSATGDRCLAMGGRYTHRYRAGLFCFMADEAASVTGSSYSARMLREDIL